MPSRPGLTKKGRNAGRVVHGPRDGVAGIDGSGSSWAVAPWTRPAQNQLDATPIPQTSVKQSALVCIISPVSTQPGPRGRSVEAPKVCSAKTGQIGRTRIKTTTTTLTPRPRTRTRSPEDWRHSTGQLLNCVPEDAEMSAEEITATRRSETSLARRSRSPRIMTQEYYGATSVTGYPTFLEIDDENELSEEEEEYLLDEELAKSGLYRGAFLPYLISQAFDDSICRELQEHSIVVHVCTSDHTAHLCNPCPPPGFRLPHLDSIIFSVPALSPFSSPRSLHFSISLVFVLPAARHHLRNLIISDLLDTHPFTPVLESHSVLYFTSRSHSTKHICPRS